MIRKILCFLGFHHWEAHQFMTKEGIISNPLVEIAKTPYFECSKCKARID